MTADAAVAVLKAISEPTRLRLLRVLLGAKDKELCNCELVDALEEPQPNVSRHLRVLAQAGIVRERRDGRWVYYGVSTEEPILAALQGVVGSLDDPSWQRDAQRVRERLGLRDRGRCVLGVQNKRLLSVTASSRRVNPPRRRKEARR